jgi:hypothetical protein
MLVYALIKDLIFRSKIRESFSQRKGIELKFFRDHEQITKALQSAPFPERVYIALEDLPLEKIALLATTIPAGCEKIAYASHINSEAISTAESSGFTKVLTKSRLVNELGSKA